MTTTAPTAERDRNALEIRHFSKRFGGSLALDDVSLSIRRGEVHGLLGSNGSGKSTLIKILSGFHQPEAGGQLTLYGKAFTLPVKPDILRDNGLSFVHQHLGLLPTLSVTENLYSGKLSTENNWRINWTAAHENAQAVFERYELDLDPRSEVASLSSVQQALLAIVRANEGLREASRRHRNQPGVLVLDEPTPFLPQVGVEQLFELIRRCVSTGASVIFVSHDIDEVKQITDRASILRNGSLVDTVISKNISHQGFVSRIIGRELEQYSGTKKPLSGGDIRFRAIDVASESTGPLSMTCGRGEILGLTGLIGSGFDTVPSMLYGAHASVSGQLMVDEQTFTMHSMKPRRALDAGIAYLPADRLGKAGVGSLSVADNICQPVLGKLRGMLGLTQKRLHEHTRTLAANAGVTPNSPALPLAALSGGNAQKVLMAKWLQIAPDVLLLDEPTQGVDVGARQQLWDALDAIAAEGTAVVIASTDYEQLANLCHRVLVFSQGQIIAELSGSNLSKNLIAEHCYRSQTRIA
ncbi:MAG: sugar ABC transporter ATP-binding protein [Granulosicoccus sp.]